MRIFARLLVLLPLLWVEGIWAVDCPGSHYWLDSQAEVDHLGGLGCDTITGDLELVYSSDISSLSSLSGLTSIGGRLAVNYNPALQDLDGLSGLSFVGGAIHIYGNAVLTNLDGLINITNVSGDLHIYGNDSLNNLDGLANITTVQGELSVSSNERLFNLDGLVSLNSVGRLHLNGSFPDLDSLVNLGSVAESLSINNVTDCQGIAPALKYPNARASLDFTLSLGQCGSVQDIFDSVVAPVSSFSERLEHGVVLVDFEDADVSNSPFSVTGYEAACVRPGTGTESWIDQPLIDNTAVMVPLDIQNQPLSRLALYLEIEHPRPDHLQILIHTPSGQTIYIWDREADEPWQGFKSFEVPITLGAELGDRGWTIVFEDVEVGPITREGYLHLVGVSWEYLPYSGVADSSLQSPIEVDGMPRGYIYQCWFAPVSQLGANPKQRFTANLQYRPPTGVTANFEGADESADLQIRVADNGGESVSSYRGFCASSLACASCVIKTSWDGEWPACLESGNTTCGAPAPDGGDEVCDEIPEWVDPCADQMISHAVSSSPSLTLSGLQNGQGYWCSVQAENSKGLSEWEPALYPGVSAQPNLIPEYSPTGLPIWLLYQATQ